MSDSKVDNPFDTQGTSDAYNAVDEVYRKSALGVKSIFDPMSLGKEANIVDLGAGTGISSEILYSEELENFCLVEPSLAMLEHAQKRLGNKVFYVQANAEDMHKAFNKDLDLVYALNCVHLFPDFTKAFAGIAASLRQGGKLIFNITAPSFSFDEVSDIEKQIYQANVDFYRALNEVSENPILRKTVDLLQDNLDGKTENVLTQDSLKKFFGALNYKFIDMKIFEIEADIEYQKNIWRMMAKSFIDDETKVNELIDKIKLPEKMLIKQAVFIFENSN